MLLRHGLHVPQAWPWQAVHACACGAARSPRARSPSALAWQIWQACQPLPLQHFAARGLWGFAPALHVHIDVGDAPLLFHVEDGKSRGRDGSCKVCDQHHLHCCMCPDKADAASPALLSLLAPAAHRVSGALACCGLICMHGHNATLTIFRSASPCKSVASDNLHGCCSAAVLSSLTDASPWRACPLWVCTVMAWG